MTAPLDTAQRAIVVSLCHARLQFLNAVAAIWPELGANEPQKPVDFVEQLDFSRSSRAPDFILHSHAARAASGDGDGSDQSDENAENLPLGRTCSHVRVVV